MSTQRASRLNRHHLQATALAVVALIALFTAEALHSPWKYIVGALGAALLVVVLVLLVKGNNVLAGQAAATARQRDAEKRATLEEARRVLRERGSGD